MTDRPVPARAGAPTAYAARYPNIPYIAAWSAEQPLRPGVFTDRWGRVAYTDEVGTDRDSNGVLWTRVGLRQGQGVPQLGRIHPLRQRRVMRGLLCQVCAGPADRNEQGILWLLSDQTDRPGPDWPDWPEDTAATHPPVCLPCARVATRACPHLRAGHVAVRVREAPISGVYGALCHPHSPTTVDDALLDYADPRTRHLIAAQLVRKLHACTIVPLP
jgi:hypothetical protein